MSAFCHTTNAVLKWFRWFVLGLGRGTRIGCIVLSRSSRLTDEFFVEFLFHFCHDECIPAAFFDSDANLVLKVVTMLQKLALTFRFLCQIFGKPFKRGPLEQNCLYSYE